jgi:hypothetical protein
LTDQQEMVVEQLYQQLIQSGAQLQLTIKQKAGQDSRAWPIAGRMNLFVNKPKQDNSYQQQSYQQPQGGNSEW